ncbi:MAG: hypothetical protein ABSE49_01235 [Polyangiaceae bacterium]|jgi:hypothetical protein
MKRSISSLLIAALLPVGAAVAVLSTSTDAQAQRWGGPSPAYVARYRPVYYNGYAHYYYGGRWTYYRPGYGWYGYATPPGEICHYAYDYYGDRSVHCN